MNIKTLRLLAIAGLLLMMLIWPAAAPTQPNPKDTNCPKPGSGGAIGAVTVANVTLTGDCELNGTIVNGSVKGDGASLTLTAYGATIHGGIEVKSGGNVTLNATTVSGGVTLDASDDLTVKAGSTVANISMKGSGDVELEDGASTGGISMTDSGKLTVKNGASAGEVLLLNSKNVVVNGSTVAAILSTRSDGVSLDGATVFPGGVTMVQNTASLEICDSDIGIGGSGGVTVVESGGIKEDMNGNPIPANVLAEADGSCYVSQIEGSVLVSKGTGDVKLEGTDLEPQTLKDLIVIEQAGEVSVKYASLSDVKVDKLQDRVVTVGTPPTFVVGSVTLKDVTTDSDVSIAEITGDAMITGDSTIGRPTLGGDVEIKFAGDVTLDYVTTASDTSITDNGDVSITDSALHGDLKITSNNDVTVGDLIKGGNNFFLEDVSISNNTGSVTVDSNCDLSLSIVENGGDVTITNNNEADALAAGVTTCNLDGFGLTDVNVSKNLGLGSFVEISDNTGELLKCSDNSSDPFVDTSVGSNNFTVSPTDGQCKGF